MGWGRRHDPGGIVLGLITQYESTPGPVWRPQTLFAYHWYVTCRPAVEMEHTITGRNSLVLRICMKPSHLVLPPSRVTCFVWPCCMEALNQWRLLGVPVLRLQYMVPLRGFEGMGRGRLGCSTSILGWALAQWEQGGGGVRPAHARRATFVLSILALAPSLSSAREVPQVDRTRPCKARCPKYENSTTQNVTPTTSNHHPCHRHKLGAKDGPES